MAKLTVAQKGMLERLKAGDRVYVSVGIRSSAYWRKTMEAANLNTVWALLDRDLAAKADEDWRGFTVVLA